MVVRPIRSVLALLPDDPRRVVPHQLVEGLEPEVVDPFQQSLLRRRNPRDHGQQPLPDLLHQAQPDLISRALVCSSLHGGSLSPALLPDGF